MKLISFKTGNRDKIGVLKGKEITEINSSMINAIKSPNMDKFESLGTYNIEDVNVSSSNFTLQNSLCWSKLH